MNHRKPKHAKPRMLVLPDTVRRINAFHSVVEENIEMLDAAGVDTEMIQVEVAAAQVDVTSALNHLLNAYRRMEAMHYGPALKNELNSLQIKTEL